MSSEAPAVRSVTRGDHCNVLSERFFSIGGYEAPLSSDWDAYRRSALVRRDTYVPLSPLGSYRRVLLEKFTIGGLGLFQRISPRLAMSCAQRKAFVV